MFVADEPTIIRAAKFELAGISLRRVILSKLLLRNLEDLVLVAKSLKKAFGYEDQAILVISRIIALVVVTCEMEHKLSLS